MNYAREAAERVVAIKPHPYVEGAERLIQTAIDRSIADLVLSRFWTSDKPTQPGWYWYRKYKSWTPELAHIIRETTGSLAYDGWDVRFQDGEWAGPIPEPSERNP